MQTVFVMVKCDLGKAYEVALDISDRISEVSEIYSVSGTYDLLTKFYLEKDEDIGRFICERLQTLPNITDTQTIITFKAFRLDAR